MLTYKKILLTFLSLVLIVLALDYFMPVHAMIYGGIVFAFIAFMAWGSKNIQANFYVNSLCSGDKNTREIALTFDDGPDVQVTPMILDVLKEHNVKAVFFVVGKKAENNPDLIKRIDKEGHIIGGHSYSHHFFFDLFSKNRMHYELQLTDDIIFRITGKRLVLFRPPYGVTNPPLAKVIRAMQYQSIGWSLKSNDTVVENENAILSKIKSAIRNGDILLFHDNKPWTVKVIKELIGYLREKEIGIARVDKLLKIHAYVH